MLTERATLSKQINNEQVLQNISSTNTALLCIDAQRDFMQDGAFGIAAANKGYVGSLQDMADFFEDRGCMRVFTKDAHGQHHISFVPNALWSVKDKPTLASLSEIVISPMLIKHDDIYFFTYDQETKERNLYKSNKPEIYLGLAFKEDAMVVLSADDQKKFFPRHCIVGTEGQELVVTGTDEENDLIWNKGENPCVDSFSAFIDEEGNLVTDENGKTLANHLRKKGIETLVVDGVATDFCVKANVLHALQEGFNVIVLTDLIRAAIPNNSNAAIKEMQQAGAIIMSSEKFKTSVPQLGNSQNLRI